MYVRLLPFQLAVVCLAASLSLHAQSLGSAGTIEGTVKDPSGAAVPGVLVQIRNPLSGYKATATSSASGNTAAG